MKYPPHASPTPDSAPADAMLLLDNQLCFALYSTSLAMTRLYKPLLDALGLTYPQYLAHAGAVGARRPDRCPNSGERLFLDSGTLTPLLKRLEVVRAGDAPARRRDERRVHITLTPAGRALKDAGRKNPRLHPERHAVLDSRTGRADPAGAGPAPAAAGREPVLSSTNFRFSTRLHLEAFSKGNHHDHATRKSALHRPRPHHRRPRRPGQIR